ncbi:MAG: hypothetical protein IKZ39_06930, partial [Lachnospiraceae bacterium]|nr:hypothetical protein [Lachnospiraceae bacterium]
MAIKIEIGQTQDVKRLNNVIDSLIKITPRTTDLDKLITELKKIASGDKKADMEPFSMFVDTWEVITDKKLYLYSSKYDLLYQNAKRVYDDICILGEKTPDFETKAELYREIIKEDGAILTGGYLGTSFDYNLFASFADKANFKTLIHAIKKTETPDKILDAVSEYGLRVREYIIDDYGYLSNLLSVVKKLAA